MKKFVFVFLVLSLFISSTSFASDPAINPNPYPVYINGVEAAVEAYNIDGFTYLKLADMSKAGLEVKFNETLKKIEVTSALSASSTKGGNDVSNTPEELKVPLNKYGLPDFTGWQGSYPALEVVNTNTFFTYDGVKYISITKRPGDPLLVPSNFRFERFVASGRTTDVIVFKKKNSSTGMWETAIDEVPYAIKGGTYITYDYYLNTILPLTQGG